MEYERNADYIAKVLEVRPDGLALVEQKNKFLAGETLQWMSPQGSVEFQCRDMRDEEGNALQSAPHPKQRVWLPLPAARRPATSSAGGSAERPCVTLENIFLYFLILC